MNTNASQIRHPGIVDAIKDGIVYVKIQPQSACGSCRSKSLCNLSDSEGKVVEAKVGDNSPYKLGQEVTVTLQRSLGYRALLLGYLIPFVLLVATIVISLQVTGNEGFSAFMGVVLMVPYFGLLYRFRESIKKKFEFRIMS